MPMPPEEEMQNAPVMVDFTLRLHGQMVRCQGYIPLAEWTALGNHEAQFEELRLSMAKSMGAVLDQVERSKMLQDTESCPDPAQTPE
jgi:hypothetical protein